MLLVGGTSRLLRKARGLDLTIINVRQNRDLAPDAKALCEEVHTLALNNVSQVTQFIGTLHDKYKFSQAICHSEPLQMLTGHICTEVGIQGTPLATVKALRDKFALRSLMREQGLSSIDSKVVASSEELVRFAASHGEAIAKPRSGGGSFGVHLIQTPEEAQRAWTWAQSVGLSEMLVEEVLHGPEISIEVFSQNGEHFPLAATSKTLSSGFVEIGHCVPAPIAANEFADACQLATSVLNLVGYRSGPSHTEIIFTSKGPEIIESHTRRAGNHINELVRLARGIDMEELCFRLAAGEKSSVLESFNCSRPAAIQLLTATAGRVVAVNGLDEVRANDDVAEAEVYVTVGDFVQELRWSGDYAGHVIVRGNTPAEALNAAERYAAQISIETVSSSEAGEYNSHPQLSFGDIQEALDPFDETWTHQART